MYLMLLDDLSKFSTKKKQNPIFTKAVLNANVPNLNISNELENNRIIQN